MAKLKLIQDSDSDVHIHNDLSQGNLIKIQDDYPELQVEFDCKENMFSGTKLIEIDGETRLILEYSDAVWPDDKAKTYFDLWGKGQFPYKKNAKGELENVVSTEDIVAYSHSVSGYTVDGHRVFSVDRGEMWDYNIQDFGIRFNESNFVLCVSRGLYNAMETTTTTYNYNGQILDQKNRRIDAESLIAQELGLKDLQTVRETKDQSREL